MRHRSALLSFAGLFSLGVFCLLTLAPPPAAAQDEPKPRDQVFDEKMAARLKKVLESSPEDDFILGKLIDMYRTFKTVEELLTEYEEKAKADPQNASLHLIVGSLYQAEGKNDLARERFERASQLDPKSNGARLAMASLLEASGEKARARTLYEEALGVTTDKITRRELLRKLIGLAVAAKDISKAKEYAKTLSKSDPQNLYLAMELPQILSQAEFYEEAILELQSLLKSANDGKAKVTLLKELGSAYEAKGDDKNALLSYEKAISMTLKGNSARPELRERIVAVYRKNDEVRTYIALLEKEGGKGFEEWELLGRLYEEVAENQKAATSLEKAIGISPKRLEVRERLIRIYERIGRFDEMLKQYRALIKAAPNDPRWPILLADLLEQRKETDEALKILADMRKRYASDPSVRITLAELYARFGRKEDALKEREALVKLEPKLDSHIIELGEAYWQMERYAEAKSTWKKLLTIIPEEDRAYATYAVTLGQHDLFDEAVDAYRKAIGKNPKELSYKKSLAMDLERAKRRADALAAWKEIVAETSFPRAARREAREHMVMLYKELGELKTQAAMAQKAFENNPPDLEKGAFLALAHLQLDQEKEAISVLKILAQKDPQNPEPLHDLESIYSRLQLVEEAIKVLEKLARLEPYKAREYYHKISEHLTRLRRDEDALVFMEKALALGPTDAAGYAKQGEILRKQTKLEEATAAYEKAISLDRRAFEHYFTLAGIRVLGEGEEERLGARLGGEREGSCDPKTQRHRPLFGGRLARGERQRRSAAYLAKRLKGSFSDEHGGIFQKGEQIGLPRGISIDAKALRRGKARHQLFGGRCAAQGRE